MTIRVGTIVTRVTPDGKEIPCEDHIDWARHAEDNTPGELDICLGVVIEVMPDENEVTVNWLQMCPFAKSRNYLAQQRIDYNLLLEVGQLL